MTDAQKKSLVALKILAEEYGGDQYFSRLRIAWTARGDMSGPGYPLKTLLALRSGGFVEPEFEESIELVLKKRCRCACDRWRLTVAGVELVETFRVRFVGGGH